MDDTRATCRVCGCWELQACEPACWWVEPDLCSGCVVKVRPVLFSAQMVLAILAGGKTQTRRVLKPQPAPLRSVKPGARGFVHEACPYGKAGDRLWVRENGWERPERTPRQMREGADTWAPYYYDADGIDDADAADFKAWGFKRRPSIHMPRWASRITLEITETRMERLHHLSEDDAIAEGIDGPMCAKLSTKTPWRNEVAPVAVHAYATLWDQINGAGAWMANPWVWVIAFKRIEKQHGK